MYNVKELLKNLKGKIAELELDEEFLNHPTFDLIVSNIEEIIKNMHLEEKSEKVIVNVDKEHKIISFSATSPDGKKYEMSIYSCNIPKHIEYFYQCEDDTNEKITVTETSATMNNNSIKVTTDASVLTKKEDGKYINTTSETVSDYNFKGETSSIIYKEFPTHEIMLTDRLTAGSFAYQSIFAFQRQFQDFYKGKKTLSMLVPSQGIAIYTDDKGEEPPKSSLVVVSPRYEKLMTTIPFRCNIYNIRNDIERKKIVEEILAGGYDILEELNGRRR